MICVLRCELITALSDAFSCVVLSAFLPFGLQAVPLSSA